MKTVKRVSNIVTRKHVSVQLSGGVGNQLFMYYAGLYLSIKQKRILRVNLFEYNARNSKHKSDLAHFNLGNTKNVIFTRNRTKHRILDRVFAHCRRRINLIDKFFNVVLKQYKSKVIGFDSYLELNRNSIKHIDGYFQTWRYVQDVIEKNDHFLLNSLSKASQWYISQSQIMLNQNITAIHVRRKDYKSETESIGLLSRSYFMNAIAVVKMSAPNDPIWIFSDDIDECMRLFHDTELRNAHYVKKPENVNDIEELLLMSFAKNLIISNSTFSWWSAFLAGESAKVYAPEKWFRFKLDPKDLIPKQWIKLDSDWEID